MTSKALQVSIERAEKSIRAVRELSLLADHLRVKKDFEGLKILSDAMGYMCGKL
jgi:hypothetical protein